MRKINELFLFSKRQAKVTRINKSSFLFRLIKRAQNPCFDMIYVIYMIDQKNVIDQKDHRLKLRGREYASLWLLPSGVCTKLGAEETLKRQTF